MCRDTSRAIQGTRLSLQVLYVLFQYSTVIVIVLLSCYFLLNLYNTAWLLVPSMGKLRRIMRNFRKKCSANTNSQLEDFYYNNRDIRLLLNLLSDSQGLASPLRCLSLIDQTFHDDLSPIITKSKFLLHIYSNAKSLSLFFFASEVWAKL